MTAEKDREPLSTLASQASVRAGSVFLSYASEDAAAAQRIAAALRAGGIEVWLDQSALRGGEAWDRKIRQGIQDCALFMPVISANAHARVEGFFRLEWKLAVDRSHLMAPDQTFLLPVVIDNTPPGDERIPDRFREVQWSRLPDGQVPPAFTERVRGLLSPGEPEAPTSDHEVTGRGSAAGPPTLAPTSGWSRRGVLATVAVVILVAAAYFAFDRLRIPKPAPPSPAAAVSTAPPVFAPPPHSIAVLPFVNMSGDASQEYFADALTEELLSSLSRINELQVAARTSSFAFKGEKVDVGAVARKLNVAAVLEGSVRRSPHTVRITAQLINAVTGFHLWSETYDRDLGDVLELQTDIANAVASALKVTLLGNVAAKIELGGTHNAAAFDAYLRARKAYFNPREAKEDQEAAIAGYTEAIRLDPNYALAFAGRSLAVAVTLDTGQAVPGVANRERLEKAEADARRAIALAPELGQAHLALAYVMQVGALDFVQANEEYERAAALAPGNAQVLRDSGLFAAFIGRYDAGIAAARRAVVLDPLSATSQSYLGLALYSARRYGEAADALAEAISLVPDYREAYGDRGFAFYGLRELQSARLSCETKRDHWASQWCLAVVYDKLGRGADAKAELAKLKAAQGERFAYAYATIYTQWGDRLQALEWLETAMRLRDPGLVTLKTDPLLDPLRHEPRFEAIERQLKFPG
jgi:TolB-like protein/Flp pilus assembly protein TadD